MVVHTGVETFRLVVRMWKDHGVGDSMAENRILPRAVNGRTSGRGTAARYRYEVEK